ncbi:MAG: SGNH/GDSL hydrolase family protein [Actinomycetota bacterium]|nr:SGNH/GDSL hydrolase family protein [Actinomycetota bacterium]
MPARPRPFFHRHRLLAVALALVLAAVSVWAVRLVSLQREVSAYRTYWSVPHGSPGGLRYVALGDSAAQGIGASDPQHGYVSLLAERLRRSTGRPVEVLNLSRSGARIDDVLRDQVPQLASLHADVVTVDVGGNDVVSYDAVDWARGAARLCDALPAGRTVVADVPWFMHGRWERRAADARRVLQADCAARAIPVAPLRDAFVRHGWAGMFTLYAADWFHPNDHGHRIWADALFPPLACEVGRS